jgi:hypothetical protein
MAFLDFIKNRNASPQQSVAQTPQPQTPAPTVESLPANVKAQAVEDARPAAQLMDKATTPRDTPEPPSSPSNTPSRGRSLGMKRRYGVSGLD